MNTFKPYKRTSLFLWLNIGGLAIGLAVSIMLTLFVVYELSYDSYFANRDRIVRLITASIEGTGEHEFDAINLGSAYLEIPSKVAGVEAAVQFYDEGYKSIKIEDRAIINNLSAKAVEPEIFKVFSMKFIEGTPENALSDANSIVLNRRAATLTFGSPEAAINQRLIMDDMSLVVSAVVEDLPKNTHITFDLLYNIDLQPFLNYIKTNSGLEFTTYFLIRQEASISDTRKAIEAEYTLMLQPWAEDAGAEAWGETEMLNNVYLYSKAWNPLGEEGSMSLIWILTALALFILILAVTNFINLFITQGEMRMHEIGIRKSNGAQISDIVRQFFSEITKILLLAFIIGFAIAIACLPLFGKLIDKEIDPMQIATPPFIFTIILLFAFTVILSAFYPAIYLSRFSPLDILGNRTVFNKRRLTTFSVVLQSVISIALLTFILTLFKQTAYLKDLPLGYNPHQVMSFSTNENIRKSYKAINQELLRHPGVKAVSGSHHIVGGGYSGQTINPLNSYGGKVGVNEYRLMAGMPELMEFELVEGRFWSENDPDSLRLIILNESAVKALGGESPLEKRYYYQRETQVIGVVKDFYYDNPIISIAPMVLSRIDNPNRFNIRFDDNLSRAEMTEITANVLHRFDPEFLLEPTWSIDMYIRKFKEINNITRIISIGSALSILIALLGLLSIHLYTSVRRKKEIAIRRINGAKKSSIFYLLSIDVLKWIAIAGVIAIPIAIYGISNVLNNYDNYIKIDWTLFALPIITQCLIALLVTSGVTLWVSSRNPAEAIKTE